MHLLRCGDKRTRPHPLLTRPTLAKKALTIPVTERMALTRANWPDMRADGHAVESICRVMREQGCRVAARTYRVWRSHGYRIVQRGRILVGESVN